MPTKGRKRKLPDNFYTVEPAAPTQRVSNAIRNAIAEVEKNFPVPEGSEGSKLAGIPVPFDAKKITPKSRFAFYKDGAIRRRKKLMDALMGTLTTLAELAVNTEIVQQHAAPAMPSTMAPKTRKRRPRRGM